MSGKKELIMASALRLLEQNEYREISVLDLVADSKVNRNTFYYHFKDMPALMRELAIKGAERCFAQCRGDAAEKLSCLVELMARNRVKIIHVYSSADRADFDEGLALICEYVSSVLCGPGTGREADNAARALLVKSCCYGLASEWFARNMDEDDREKIISACAEFLKHI